MDSAHNFHYHDLFSGRDAGSLTVIKDDRIAWVLDSAIDPRTFQIDFGEINPFHIFRPATLRGRDHIVSEKVNFPAGFPGNRVLKYSVSLGNGLRDDPDVTPVESDPGQILHGLVVYGLALEPDCKIRWTSVYFVDISLNPPEIVKSLGGETKANVNWKWDIGSTDPMPEFDVHFPDTVPAGCLRDTHSRSGAVTIAVGLLARTRFQIITTSGDGANPISKDGYLTINP